MSKSDQEPSNTLISRSLKVIASKIKGEKGLSLLFFLLFRVKMLEYNSGLCEWTGIDFLEFRPSEVAAAVALSVSGELYTVHFDSSSLSLFSPLQKVNEIPL